MKYAYHREKIAEMERAVIDMRAILKQMERAVAWEKKVLQEWRVVPHQVRKQTKQK